MVTEPHDFLHFKEVGEKTLKKAEEGVDNVKINTSTEFQKYFWKQQPVMYIGYDHKVGLKNDEFLNSLGKEEKKGFDEEVKKIWREKASLMHPEDLIYWYMILEGTRNGEKQVKLYQDQDVFEKVRDEGHPPAWSLKACYFEDLDTAKNYIQMARDEEGVHWDWPKEIPVIWKKGPLTKIDLENLPGFQSSEEEETEEN
jgi:hypothetical protein